MGGYAGYVWPAFVIVLVVMAVLWVASRRGCRNSEHTLAALRKIVNNKKLTRSDP